MKKGPIKFILALVFLGLIFGTTFYIYQNKGDNAEKVSSQIDKLMSKNNIKKQKSIWYNLYIEGKLVRRITRLFQAWPNIEENLR